jgi:hypothetical protein
MPKQQQRPGIRTVNKKHPQLRGADIAAAILARLGTQHKDAVVICADEQTFFKEYLPSLTVDGETIKLGPDTLPLPVVIARRLADRPGSKVRKLEELRSWLRDGASDRDVLQLVQGLN